LGVYKKLSHPHINKYIEKSRSLYNITLSEMSDTAKLLSTAHNLDPFALVLIADQRPSNPRKAFWTYFLNRETAFFYGAEKFSLDYGYPVLFFRILRVKRGYYRVEIDVLCENPADLKKGELIKRYRDKLESAVRERPAEWLWSHNRWKHKRPEGMPIQD
jgi:KDO2-lipid IV(A) lauroyltransferase